MHNRISDRFTDKLLKIPFTAPQADLIALCNAWVYATHAAWVWLWIKNMFSGEWELRMHHSAIENTEYIPTQLNTTDRSVAEYSARKMQIIELSDHEFKTWCKTEETEGLPVTYRCLSAESLLQFGCKRFVCIPITSGFTSFQSQSNPHALNLFASICVHYLDDSTPAAHDDLQRMGSLSNFLISNSYRSRNERTLFSLNQIDAKFAFSEGQNPRRMLNEYVDKLLQLVCEKVGANCASLFFDLDRNGEQVCCIGTTVTLLNWADKHPIGENDLRKAIYLRNQHKTGEVFASGNLCVINKEDDRNRTPKYVESSNGEPFLGRSTAFIPLRLIYGDANDSDQSSFRTVGVLRCVGRAVDQRGVRQTDTFDQIDLETLQFVCDQIAPVIQTLVARIERERAISIVKHDLVSPISHIRHIADKLETIQQVSVVESIESLQGGRRKTYQMRIPFRDLMNIKTFAIEASNLVYQLDPDFSHLTKVHTEETFLEGNIMARLKRAMQYHAWEEKKMNILFDGFDNIPSLKIDRGIIERVFYNLISNAIKYGKQRTAIQIKAFEQGEYYCVTVSNLGRGVSEDERTLIFDEEYRSNVAIESEVPGLGLGLYIARKAMEKHGGKLELLRLADPTIFCAFFPTSLRAT